MRILAIETSCDETAVAVIEGNFRLSEKSLKIVSNVVFSQIPLHRKHGGVVPEVASRAHLEKFFPTLKKALNPLRKNKAESFQKLLNKIDVFAVTIGPGLLGSLLVGVNFAKALSWATQKPLIPVNHLEGHIYANWLQPISKLKIIKFPSVCLIVSGGHTSLVLMKNHLQYKILGQTLDDAAGECFDKVGKLLDIPYPAGPQLEKLAKKGNPKAFSFPRPIIDNSDFNFSFSGLKTAVLYTLKYQKLNLKNSLLISDICASFQEAVTEVLVKKTIKAALKFKALSVIVSGGVAANKALQKAMSKACYSLNLPLFFPPSFLCTDNAAMIGTAAFYSSRKNKKYPLFEIEANPNLSLG